MSWAPNYHSQTFPLKEENQTYHLASSFLLTYCIEGNGRPDCIMQTGWSLTIHTYRSQRVCFLQISYIPMIQNG